MQVPWQQQAVPTGVGGMQVPWQQQAVPTGVATYVQQLPYLAQDPGTLTLPALLCYEEADRVAAAGTFALILRWWLILALLDLHLVPPWSLLHFGRTTTVSTC